jgi:hypothetical protein
MMHRLAICLVIAAVSLAAPRPAAAVAVDVYDTVDSVEIDNSNSSVSGSPPTLQVTGIPAGATTPITRTYTFFASAAGVAVAVDTAMHCQRLAVVAMSKPGKFQFAIGPAPSFTAHGCKLILRTP